MLDEPTKYELELQDEVERLREENAAKSALIKEGWAEVERLRGKLSRGTLHPRGLVTRGNSVTLVNEGGIVYESGEARRFIRPHAALDRIEIEVELLRKDKADLEKTILSFGHPEAEVERLRAELGQEHLGSFQDGVEKGLAYNVAEIERLREIENAARTVEYAERVGIPAEIAMDALRRALEGNSIETVRRHLDAFESEMVRKAGEPTGDTKGHLALDRIEAEVKRLREENKYTAKRCLDAEAEVERLREVAQAVDDAAGLGGSGVKMAAALRALHRALERSSDE